jgi:adenylate kinase family enzyme
MRRCVIVRGLPGSGKSTLSGKIYKDTLEGKEWPLTDGHGDIYSTDDYFMHNGEYTFNGRQLTKAHDWNRARVERAIDNEYDIVIVDNTNTQFWEMAAYIEYALDHDYVIEVVEPQTEWAFDPPELFKRNTHGVPMEAILKMKSRWDSLISLCDTFREKYKVDVDAKIVGGKVIGLEFSNGV